MSITPGPLTPSMTGPPQHARQLPVAQPRVEHHHEIFHESVLTNEQEVRALAIRCALQMKATWLSTFPSKDEPDVSIDDIASNVVDAARVYASYIFSGEA